jgi:hypothetical protein
VPDDRFADLDAGTRAGDRFAELDRRDPEPAPPPPRRRGRYTWVVGVAAVIAIIVAGVNSIPNEGRGFHGPPVGKELPRFAAPLATGPADGDPNTKQSANDKGAPNKTPACQVRVPGALRICDYETKPLVVTFIVPTGACERYVDRLERARARFPGVNFVTVVSATNKSNAGKLVRDHGWKAPVALDRNGAVLNAYNVAVCATSIFAYRGGIVRGTKVEAQRWTDAQLDSAIRVTEPR